MENSFVPYFGDMFPRLMLWLVVPFYLGFQISYVAQEERKKNPDSPLGSYMLDAIALFFSVAVPAFMLIFSFGAYFAGDSHADVLAIMFRYVVMFFFLGIWWEVFAIMAVKAYRDRNNEISKLKYLAFYVGISVFVSLNAFMGGEWFLKWGSMIFFALAAPLILLPARTMSKAFIAVALLGLFIQTVGFIYVNSAV